MPPEGVPFKPHDDILAYEDMEFFVRAAAQLGITKVRITGGEPLVRRGLPGFVGRLRAIPEITDISLTTNGVLLPRFAAQLKAEGLNRVNISLDSLDRGRFRTLTRGGSLDDALAGVDAALEARSQTRQAERRHAAGGYGGTAGLRGVDQREAAPRALHRVDGSREAAAHGACANRSPRPICWRV